MRACSNRPRRLGAQAWGADWCRYSTGGSTHANQVLALGDRCAGRQGPGSPELASQRAARASSWPACGRSGCRPRSTARSACRPGCRSPLSSRRSIEHSRCGGGLVCRARVRRHDLGSRSRDRSRPSTRPARVWSIRRGVRISGFHPDYPAHAMALGADAMVTSAHKTLVGYSQGALVVARTRAARSGSARAWFRGLRHDQSGRLRAGERGCARVRC